MTTKSEEIKKRTETDELTNNPVPVLQRKCNFCYKIFNSKSELEHHKKVFHVKGKTQEANKHKAVLIIKGQLPSNNPNPILLHKCTTCLKIFVNETEFEQHKKVSHPEAKKVDEATKSKTLILIKGHSSTNKQTSVLLEKCSSCSKILFNDIELEEHLKSSHAHEKKEEDTSQGQLQKKDNGSVILHMCSICSKILVNKSAWEQHTKESHVQGEKAEESVKSQPSLVSKEPIFLYKCPICPKIFIIESEYDQHEKESHGEKNQDDDSNLDSEDRPLGFLECCSCDKIFPRYPDTVTYLLNTEGARMIICPRCGQGLILPS